MKRDERKVRSDKVTFLFYQSLAVYFLLCRHKLAAYLFFEISSFFSLISFVLQVFAPVTALMRFKLGDIYFLSLSLSLCLSLSFFTVRACPHTQPHIQPHTLYTNVFNGGLFLVNTRIETTETNLKKKQQNLCIS